jgi:hypothetical protein
VEIHALARRGWSVSAIAPHTGRDRKTVRKYLKGPGPSRARARSCLEPFGDYLTARLADDAHVDGTVLYREVVGLGFERSYVTFVRELRRLGLRPRCEACRSGGHGVTVELAHEPGALPVAQPPPGHHARAAELAGNEAPGDPRDEHEDDGVDGHSVADARQFGPLGLDGGQERLDHLPDLVADLADARLGHLLTRVMSPRPGVRRSSGRSSSETSSKRFQRE